jgi:uncharacterized membrane protein YgdD (TMEM256/DUF423 family)
MNWSAIAAIFLTLAVGLGAFGAHGYCSKLLCFQLISLGGLFRVALVSP